MAKVNLYTTLSIAPKAVCPGTKIVDKFILVTRGATATFDFDLTNKCYTLNDIEQLTFMFKQGRTPIGPFIYPILTDNANPGYSFKVSEDGKLITLKLNSSITKLFKSTESRSNYAQFEITAEVVNGNESFVFVEPQPKIMVRNSLYNELLDD